MDARRIVRWTWLPVVLIVLYAGATVAMRWNSNRALEKDAQQRQAAADRAIVEQYGSGELKLLTFYANPPQVAAGGRSLLCYGVANATAVTIEPDVEGVAPSLSRCVEVRPKATTTYTFTATGPSGGHAVKTVTINVQ